MPGTDVGGASPPPVSRTPTPADAARLFGRGPQEYPEVRGACRVLLRLVQEAAAWQPPSHQGTIVLRHMEAVTAYWLSRLLDIAEGKPVPRPGTKEWRREEGRLL